MKIDHVITKPIRCHASAPIDRENMAEIADWCKGNLCHGLFVEIDGPEIEFRDFSGLYESARIGDRVVLMPDGYHRVTPAQFIRDFSVVEWESTPGPWEVGVVGG